MPPFLPPGLADAFAPVLGTMTTLFLIAFLGYLAVRLRVVDEPGVSALIRLLIDLIVPAKMLTSMMAGLNRETLTQCGVVILVMVCWTMGTLALGVLATRFWPGGERRRDHAIWALSSMQNGIYIPLPLILALVPAAVQAEATIYVGGAVLVMVLLQWSLGVMLLRGESSDGSGPSLRESLRGAFNPPMVAILAGLALSFVPPLAAVAKGQPGPALLEIPVRAAEMVGSALGPVAMIVLGMMIGGCRLRGVLTPRTLGIPLVIRLLISPLVMLWCLTSGPLAWVSPLVALVLIVQSGTPPATNLSIAARRFGGDWELVASALLVTYLSALATLPVFTALVLARGGLMP